VRAAAAAVVGRWQRGRDNVWAAFPGWPLDLSADFLADIADDSDTSGPRSTTPVVVSHDLDSAEGLRLLVERFLPLEEAVGARSVNFVVPCAWPLDHALLGEVKDRGHDVGVHGFDHANRTPFAEDAERKRRLDGAADFARRYDVAGYRAPSLLRTRALLRDLSTRYRYDSSIPTSGGLFPVPNSGCASARPFSIEGITELPVTMPRDGSLRFLGYTVSEIVELWTRCAERIADSGGIVMILTHCERRFSGNPEMLEAYRRFLTFIAERPGTFRWSRPTDLL
jgi:peptidoglycan/xylan/chitin deacetylase (PgdA/CDA1 family)